MTYFSNNPGMVRVDRFKPRGKWYDTFAVDMSRFWKAPLIHDAVEQAITEAGYAVTPDWIYVCLDPYHQHSHPIMLKGRGVAE